MSPRRQLLVLAIDAANPALLSRWAADGTLPNLGRLIETGVSGAVRGLDGFYIGSTWPSFYTGLSPAGHGLHYLVQLRRGSYELERPAERGLVRAEPFWRRLATHGRRIALLDVPLTALDETVPGVQTVEWGGHDSVYGFRAHPRELERKIRDRWGSHPGGPSCDGRRETAAEFEAFTRALESGVAIKEKITRDVLQSEPWDLAVQVFTESHCAGHQMWHLHDPDHPAHDAEIAAAVGDPLRRVYVAIDRAIGSVIHQARSGGADPSILVVSPHGMDHWFGAQFLLHDILVALEVTADLPGRVVEPGPPRLQSIRRRLPPSWKRRLRALRRRLQREGAGSGGPPSLAVDVSASQCFPHPNGLAVGGIRLNLVGREPAGVIAPHDVDRFCAELSERLLEIRDADRGHRLIRRVLRTDRSYDGPHSTDLPDLLVEWTDEVPVGSAHLAGGVGATIRATSPHIGTIQGSNEFGRSGENRRDGWFVAAVPGRTPGQRDEPVSLLDFAPTLCRLLDAPAEGFEGRPIPEIVD